MGHHRKTRQEDTDHKDSEAPVMWFPLKNWIQEYYNASFDFGVVDKVKVPDLPEGKYVLSWRWEPWISKFGRISWEFCDRLSADAFVNGKICGWVLPYVNGSNGLATYYRTWWHFSHIFRYLSMRIVRWPSKFGATVLTSPSRKVVRLPRLSAQREVGELLKLPSNLMSQWVIVMVGLGRSYDSCDYLWFLRRNMSMMPHWCHIAHTILLLQVVQPAVSSVDFVATVANVLMTRRATVPIVGSHWHGGKVVAWLFLIKAIVDESSQAKTGKWKITEHVIWYVWCLMEMSI